VDKSKEQLIQELVEIRAKLADAQALPEQARDGLEMVCDLHGRRRPVPPVQRELTAHLKLEHNYQNLFREMQDGLALQDIIFDAAGRPLDYRIVAVNPAFEKMTGLKAERVVGRTILDIMKGQEGPWIETYGRVALSGEPAYFENFAKKLNKHFEVFAYCPFPGQITCIFRDITERKKAEDALRRSEEKYREIYESSIVGIFQSVPEGRFIDVNPAFAAMLGYDSPEDLISCITDIETQYYVHPEDRKRYQSAIKQKGYVENLEYKVKGRDGSVVWVNNSSRVHIGPDGEIVRYEGIVVNITEAKKAEEALRESETLLRFAGQLALVGGWSANLSENRVKWSDATAAIHEVPAGFSPSIDEAIGYYAPEHRKKMVEVFTACAREGTPYDLETQIYTAKGKSVWVRTIGVAERDEFGQIVAVKGAFQDISERRHSEEALRQLNEALGQRNQLAEARAKQLQNLTVELIEAEERERRKFAHLLHDDLQQMLAAAKMQVQAVAARLPRELILSHAAQLLEQSINKSRRLSHELSPAVLHQSGLVAGLKWLARQMDEQFGMKIDLEIAEDLQVDNSPLKIFLFRAVQELVFNIVKHAGVRSGRVVLSGANSSLKVTVSDRGKGFDLDVIENSTGKIGFGLLTIRERASHIGGRLEIESALGHGSSFHLTLPVRPCFPERQPTAAQLDFQPLKGKKSITAATGAIRILFVDDHKVMRQGLIQLISNQADIQVVGEAANGKEAIEKTRQLRPDVIVMDVSMPVMDGIEATRHIKAEMPHVRIIGLSMFEDEHVSVAMHRVGAEAFVSKTASTAELLKAIYGGSH
jgi:PAS domain S-box-containing protein